MEFLQEKNIRTVCTNRSSYFGECFTNERQYKKRSIFLVLVEVQFLYLKKRQRQKPDNTNLELSEKEYFTGSSRKRFSNKVLDTN